MKLCPALIGIVFWLSSGLCPVALAAPANPRLSGVKSFALALGESAQQGDIVQRLGHFDLVVVDGESTSAADIGALRQRGVIVLGYLSIGTIEPYRGWYRQARRYRLEKWGDWGEWYADVSKQGFRDLIARKVAPAIMRKGFDGLFLDNFDMIADHRKQRKGMSALVRQLSSFVHSRGGVLFTQNGESVIFPLISQFDGWNREDVTWTYNFSARRYERAADSARTLNALRRVSAYHLLVTATDYLPANSPEAEREAVLKACSAGALPYSSDIELNRVPEQPFLCP